MEPLPKLVVIDWKKKPITMKDPKEKDEALPSNDDTAEQQTNDTEGNSWNEHQQVDEEGVEVDPEDVK